MNKYPLLLPFLTACAQTLSTPITSPTGEHWIGVDCTGHSQVACYAEAGNECPGGYDILENQGPRSLSIANAKGNAPA